MNHPSRSIACLAALLMFGSLSGSHSGLLAADAIAPSIRFRATPARPGDVRQQQMDFDLDVTRQVQEGNQVTDLRQQRVHKTKQRRVEIQQVQGPLPIAARIDYGKSEMRLEGGATPTQQLVDPAADKSYIVSRRGDELVIQDLQGAVPPAPELVWLKQDLATFGRENPLSTFLANREVRVGQTLDVPPEVARELLGGSDSATQVTRFQLTLEQIQTPAGHRQATFRVAIDLKGADQGGVDMLVEGHVTMNADLCQVEQVNLKGPIRSVEFEGEGANRLTLSTFGTMTVTAAMTHQTAGTATTPATTTSATTPATAATPVPRAASRAAQRPTPTRR
ncbi:MAG: hypothetical protein U0795_21705 [Pirellulales bacterium]